MAARFGLLTAADACIRAGRTDAADRHLDSAERAIERTGEHTAYAPQVPMLRAAVLLETGGEPEAIERALDESMRLWRIFESPWMELRTAILPLIDSRLRVVHRRRGGVTIDVDWTGGPVMPESGWVLHGLDEAVEHESSLQSGLESGTPSERQRRKPPFFTRESTRIPITSLVGMRLR